MALVDDARLIGPRPLTLLRFFYRERWLVTPGHRGLILKRGAPEMGGKATVVLYVVLMAAIVVAVDVLFFRNRVWERLMANIGIVLLFGAFYLRFLRRP
jgi:hypothetical protein